MLTFCELEKERARGCPNLLKQIAYTLFGSEDYKSLIIRVPQQHDLTSCGPLVAFFWGMILALGLDKESDIQDAILKRMFNPTREALQELRLYLHTMLRKVPNISWTSKRQERANARERRTVSVDMLPLFSVPKRDVALGTG
jgi:hypothetical protein